jgi:2-polyprenyl-3-methyl-5-hydroxy-6-metoxy-1,4-benzoquinol methylase
LSSELERRRVEEIAQKFDSAFDFDVYYQIGLGETLTPLLAGKRVLEVGCSSGVMSPYLAESAKRLDMLDGSQTYIDAAKEKLRRDNVRFICALFEEFQPEDPYDAIVCSHVLEHVIDPVDLLRRMKSWLAPGGVIYVCVPNAYSVHRMLGLAMGLIPDLYQLSERDHLVGHRRVYDRDSLARDIESAGLKHGPLKGVLLKPFPNSRMVDLPEALTRGLLKVGTMIPEHASEIYYECYG